MKLRYTLYEFDLIFILFFCVCKVADINGLVFCKPKSNLSCSYKFKWYNRLEKLIDDRFNSIGKTFYWFVDKILFSFISKLRMTLHCKPLNETLQPCYSNK